MIKIGVDKDLNQIGHLPIKVVHDVTEIVRVLAAEYGNQRNIETGLGGYVAIIEELQDFEQLKNAYLDIYHAIPEWVERISVPCEEDWVKALFLLSSDYAIVVVGKESLCNGILEGNQWS